MSLRTLTATFLLALVATPAFAAAEVTAAVREYSDSNCHYFSTTNGEYRIRLSDDSLRADDAVELVYERPDDNQLYAPERGSITLTTQANGTREALVTGQAASRGQPAHRTLVFRFQVKGADGGRREILSAEGRAFKVVIPGDGRLGCDPQQTPFRTVPVESAEH
jgi:hypothetical protein